MASNYMVKVYADLIRKGKRRLRKFPTSCEQRPGNPRK